jgi:RNA polymerase sigma-70 factor, ECF subfamily
MDDVEREVARLMDCERSVWPLAVRLTRNRDDALDLMQETYLKAVIQLRECKSLESPCAWLRTVMIRSHLDRRRRLLGWIRRESLQWIPSFMEPQPSPEATTIADNESARLRAALQTLEPRRRMAIVLYYLEGLTHRQAATAMDISVTLLKKELSTGLGQLDVALREEQKHEIQQHV